MRIQDVPLLVIDDVNSVRVQIRELLKASGFEKVLEARSGAEAAEILSETDIRVILCDIHMEPLDGITLLEFVRKHPRLSKSVFIMVSGDNTRAKIVEAIKAGVDDYVVKPLKKEQVQKKLMIHIAKKGVLSA